MGKLIRLSLVLFLAVAAMLSARNPQEKRAGNTVGAANSGAESPVQRGKYIVESVAMCQDCHTPRDEHGVPDRGRRLMGGPVQLRSAYPAPEWATLAPRIAGQPPGTDAELIRLWTTGISRTGNPPRRPMPQFRMSRTDAEAVLAYLKSLTP